MAVKKNEEGNPLIKEDIADTIDEIHNHIEWLCLASDSDDDIHPGLIQSLNLVREAVKSLKSNKPTHNK